jgi:hypothetical protein
VTVAALGCLNGEILGRLVVQDDRQRERTVCFVFA